MDARRFFLSTVVAATVSAAFVAPHPQLFAQDAGTVGADVEQAKHDFIGVINAPAVPVKSAPRDDAYATGRLERGTKVTVVGMKFKWLKILPPEGSFAYVPKVFVDVRGDGRVGRTTRDVSAKVGSSLNQLKTATMGVIPQGHDLEILGEQDEYWKIAPPAGSFLFVDQASVDPLKALPTPADSRPEATVASSVTHHDTAAPVANEGSPAPIAPVSTRTPTPAEVAAAPAPVPTAPPVPATQPSEVAEAFDKLETSFKAANEKPITEQPIESLLSGYEELLKQEGLSGSTRKISEIRVATLKLRSEAKADFVALKEAQQQAAERQKSLVAERDEIAQRIKEKQVVVYAAIGTLRASSIQRGGGMLYRLTDPATGRTVAYVREPDTRFAGDLGRLVGVKGNITTDEMLNMKIIENSTALDVIDPAKVNDTIAAQIVPPSMNQSVHTASTAGE